MPIRIPARNVAGDQLLATTTNASGELEQHMHSPDHEVSGSITAADAVNGANPQTGALISSAPTAGSFVAGLCPGGDSAWNVRLTGTLAGTFWFEGSLDSTNGTDGNWIGLVGRQTGTGSQTNLTMGATTAGIYRGNTAGMKYMRVRNSGGGAGPASVVIRFSSGVGPTFLNAGLPPGSNYIGSTYPTTTRTAWHLYTDALLPVTTEALVTTQRQLGSAAVAGATAHLVTTGKTLRITAGTLTIHTGGTAALNIGVRLRVNLAGAAALTSPIFAMARSGFGPTAPVANAVGSPVAIPIPNGGIEIPSGGGYAVSQVGVGTMTSAAFTLSLVGYEY